MKAVNIFSIVDGHHYLLLVDMFGQRQLYDEAINIVVAVQAVNTLQQFVFSNVALIAYEGRFEATLLASNNLVLYVCF